MALDYIALVIFVVALFIVNRYDFFKFKLNSFPNKRKFKNILFYALFNVFTYVVIGDYISRFVDGLFTKVGIPLDGFGFYLTLLASSIVVVYFMFQFTDIYER